MTTPLQFQQARLYVDVIGRQIFDAVSLRPVTSLTITENDTIAFQIALCSTKYIQPLDINEYPLSGTEYDVSGCTFKLGVKTGTAYRAGGAYSVLVDTTDTGSDWQNLTLGRVQMTMIPSVVAGNTYFIEFEVKTNSGAIITPFIVPLTVVQDLNIGTEAVPSPSAPTYYTKTEVNALLAALPFIYPVEWPFPLQVGEIDDGLYFGEHSVVTGLSGFIQIPGDADIHVQLTKNGVLAGDQMVVVANQNLGSVTFSSSVAFATTDRLGLAVTQTGSADQPGQNLRVRVFSNKG